MSIVTYQSFRRWIREIEAEREKAVDENSTIQVEAKKKNGRPKTPDEVRELILKIKSETGYGYTKIRQELAKLGIKVSRQTVKNILVAVGLHNDPNAGKDSWDAFLKRHADTMWQCDYMSKPQDSLSIDLPMVVIDFSRGDAVRDQQSEDHFAHAVKSQKNREKWIFFRKWIADSRHG